MEAVETARSCRPIAPELRDGPGDRRDSPVSVRPCGGAGSIGLLPSSTRPVISGLLFVRLTRTRTQTV